MKLTKLQRYEISNQLRILESLYPDEAKYFAKQREIFENGYELLYEDGMQHILSDAETLSEDECREVWDTMSMFDGIDRSLKNLGADHEPYVTKFQGYDGNGEGSFMSFAEFTVQKDRRFTYLPLEEEGYFNSHSEKRGIYQRMLRIWEEIPSEERYKMSRETLDKLLLERVHPSNRVK